MSENIILPTIIKEDCDCGSGKYAIHHSTACGKKHLEPSHQDIRMYMIEREIKQIYEQVSNLEIIIQQTLQSNTKILQQITKFENNIKQNRGISFMDITTRKSL